ncbi:MAG: ADP-ribosylglycohydrolase family protein [archaeon]|nr:ADP-ribosylglycohydrolase family protein [archaeon]
MPQHSGSSKIKPEIDTLRKNAKIIFSLLNNINENDFSYKPLSCIYGAFIGDAIGSFCEFTKAAPDKYKTFENKPKNIFRDYKGHVTDDSEMAMCLAMAITDMDDWFTLQTETLKAQSYLFYYYGVWKESHPKDIGNTTKIALKSFDSTKVIFSCFDDNIKKNIVKDTGTSLANGSLMRNTPLSVWLYFKYEQKTKALLKDKNFFKDSNYRKLQLEGLYKEFRGIVAKDCELTHPNPEAISADTFVCLLSVLAMNNISAKDILHLIENLMKTQIFQQSPPEKELRKKVDGFLNEIKPMSDNYYKTKYFKSFDTQCIGFYSHAIKMIIYFLYFYDEKYKNNYQKIMYEICDYGGDTDTNAAIVGSVLGPIIGLKNFGKWKEYVIQLVDRERVLYTSALMYFYVHYLHSQFNPNLYPKVKKEDAAPPAADIMMDKGIPDFLKNFDPTKAFKKVVKEDNLITILNGILRQNENNLKNKRNKEKEKGGGGGGLMDEITPC